jgi:hypothetical protein
MWIGTHSKSKRSGLDAEFYDNIGVHFQGRRGQNWQLMNNFAIVSMPRQKLCNKFIQNLLLYFDVAIWSVLRIRIPRIATKKIILQRTATVKSINLRADCQGGIPMWQAAEHLRALPGSYSCCGKPLYWSAVYHKWVKHSTSHWTSTVPLFDRYKSYMRRIV